MHEICWFCETRPASENYTVSMYKVISVEHEIIDMTKPYIETTSQTTLVSVPHCKECAFAHDRIKKYSRIGIPIGMALGLPMGIILAISGDLGSVPIFLRRELLFAAITCSSGLWGIIGWMVSSMMVNIFLLPEDTKSWNSIYSFPKIVEMKKQKWKIGNPTG
jgi:hypothetical protein